ncbi:hypothetical protein BACFIN_06442 [Bacteroides finegoldii DSM 17565]|nr:hypothetical protein BACFIN_06442 [Bacteroides finegoldii DSM 17565]
MSFSLDFLERGTFTEYPYFLITEIKNPGTFVSGYFLLISVRLISDLLIDNNIRNESQYY